ncbi:MAG: YceD family protein [Bacteroidota bacterium]
MRNDHEEIKIRISGLSNGVHEYHFDALPADLGLEEAFQTPVSLDVELEKSSRQLYLKSKIIADGIFICDRCLGEFKQTLSNQMNTVFVYNESDSKDDDGDEIRVITPETMSIDITDDVRQAIILAVPLKMLCSEDCKGLCPHCGVNRNIRSCKCREIKEIDPRWEKLKKIL